MVSRYSSPKDLFFEAARKGVVSSLQDIIARDGKKVAFKLANSFNELGETPLLLAVKGNHEDMVKFLIKNLNAPVNRLGRLLWNGTDYGEVTPLVAAILSGQHYLSIVDVLVKEDILMYRDVIKHVLKSKILRLQKIDILELTGAAYFLHLNGETSHKVGLLYWRCAMLLRYSEKNGELVIPKTTQGDDLCERFRNHFENVSEVTTMEELDTTSRNEDIQFFKIQALLASQRILNRIDHHKPNQFFLTNFYEYAVDQQLSNHLKIDAFALILESFDANQWVDAKEECPPLISRSFDRFCDAFRILMQEPQSSPNQDEQLFEILIKIARYASTYGLTLVSTVESQRLDGSSLWVSLIHFRICKLFVQFLEEKMKLQPSLRMKRCLFQYFRFTNAHSGMKTLLHILQHFRPTLPIPIIRLVLQTGANPNAVDFQGKTPLHILALNFTCENTTDVARVLLDAGCHIDQVNSNGLTALHLSKKFPRNTNRVNFEKLLCSVLPLTCCCAHVIARNRIPFESGIIPATLETFVKNHIPKNQ